MNQPPLMQRRPTMRYVIQSTRNIFNSFFKSVCKPSVEPADPASSAASEMPMGRGQRKRRQPMRPDGMIPTPPARRSRKKIIDILPEPQAPLPSIPASSSSLPSSGASQIDHNVEGNSTGSSRELPTILESANNRFGLFRRYYANSFPRHDPEENFDYADLHNLNSSSNCSMEQTSSTLPDSTWSPNPNESSFRLGL